nr:uncharacterized protein LOC109191994 [Ipomoea batatas]
MNQRWIAPESTAERKLWPGPDLVDNGVTSDGETVREEVHTTGAANIDPHQPVGSCPVPTSEAANMDAGSSGHANMHKSVPHTPTPAVNMDASFHSNLDVPVTLSNAVVQSATGETVNMEVGAGGNNTVAAITRLKRRRAHDDEQVLATMDDDAVTRCTSILYAIWSARNSAVWESKVPRPTTMVAMADKTLQNWRLSQITASSHGPMYAPGPDDQSYNRCYIDAAFVVLATLTRRAKEESLSTSAVGAEYAAMAWRQRESLGTYHVDSAGMKVTLHQADTSYSSHVHGASIKVVSVL